MTRALRFCLLATFYPPYSFGGDAIQIERLAKALAGRGHEVTVVHSREGFEALSRRRVAEPSGDARVRVIPIDSGLGPVSSLASHQTGHPVFTRRSLERVFQDEFDVVHFHNPSLLGAPAAFRLGRGIKLYTAHEQWLVCPTHVLWKYQRRVCERPQCWRCSLSYGRPPQLWRSSRLLQRSLGQLDALIVPSATSARLHAHLASLVRIVRIPHFVAEPAPEQPPPASSRPYFLFAGRLESIKGVETLLPAFARRGGEDLLIAGTGSLEPSLRRQSRDLPHVHLLGWQPAAELARLFRGARAVIVPTLGHEAFGLVPVEGFAHGRPAIVRRFGALAELIEESGGGIAYGSEPELDDALELLATNEALATELGERGRAAQRARWSVDEHLSAYFGLIAELAQARGDNELAAAALAAGSVAQAAP